MTSTTCPACGRLFAKAAEGCAFCPRCAAAPTQDGATLAPDTSAPAAAPSDDRAPPDYEILGELGRGGMGVVYKARQTALGRLVALKMILSGAHAGSDEMARFHTEAEAIAKLQHPNVVQVFEVGEHDGKPFISLEFCAGGALDARLAGTPLPAAEAAELVRQLAHALQAAHESKVIHRDLKPANVLLAADGTPKVTDFGLAKKLDEAGGRTQTGSVMGTPSYMAPEQASGSKDVGPLADVYSLGAILYECLTGRPPFRAATPLDTIVAVVETPPAPPSLLNPRTPAELEAICLKCLEKSPADRYASAAALADDLERFLAGEPVTADHGAASRLLRPWLRDSRHAEVLAQHARAWRVQALLMFPLFLATNVLFWCDAPGWAYLALWVPGMLALLAPGLYFLWRPGRVWAPVERQMNVVVWSFVGCVLLMLAQAVYLGMDLPKLVPLFIAVLALMLASVAVLLGGSLYLLAGLCALASLVATFAPSIGPAFFGLTFTVGLLVPSMKYTRAASASK